MSPTLSTMLTQCPACHTLFRIREDQLRAADGQARCCRCNQVFDALANLRDEPITVQRHALSGQWTPGTAARPIRGSPRPPPEGAHAARTAPAPAAAGVRVPEIPEPTGRPESVGGRLVLPAEPLDTAPPAHEPAYAQAAERDHPPFEIPEDLPEIAPSDEAAYPPWAEEAEPAPGPSLWSQLGWGLGALLLLAVAVGQLLWWGRDALAQTNRGRRVIEPVCAALGCQVEPRRAPTRIRVLSRDVSPHPSAPQALLVMLVMANEARFAQPFPLLQLTLYDDQERAMGQRRFTPQEYLGTTDVPPMKPDQAVYVRLELVDPGVTVTGFRFDFL